MRPPRSHAVVEKRWKSTFARRNCGLAAWDEKSWSSVKRCASFLNTSLGKFKRRTKMKESKEVQWQEVSAGDLECSVVSQGDAIVTESTQGNAEETAGESAEAQIYPNGPSKHAKARMPQEERMKYMVP